jgi:hypothetical protein
MAATQTMTIPQFLNGSYKVIDEENRILNKLIAHMERHKVAYRVIGTTVFIFLATADVAFAASTGIDVGGRRIYTKLLNVSKWIIIIKGGFDIVNATIRGDYDVAKKSFFSYLMVYIILLGLPWALDQVDTVFKDI